MNYEKQEFRDGQVLTAECLNRMEKGIKDACDAVPPACESADCSRVLSYGANGLEWIEHKPSVALIVELETWNDPWTASHSAIEITSHLDKGPVIFMSEWDFIKLNNIRNEFNGDSFAIFKTDADANGVWKEYTIDDNKKVTVKEMSLSSAVETLVVTVDDAEMMASHTSAQIYEHIQNGGAVAIKYGASSYTPSSVSESVVSCLFGVTGECVSLLEIYDDGSVVTPENFYAPIDQIPDVGDIEAALDAILAIQNELIGGDA